MQQQSLKDLIDMIVLLFKSPKKLLRSETINIKKIKTQYQIIMRAIATPELIFQSLDKNS